jgi:hyperosmotically inducible protein
MPPVTSIDSHPSTTFKGLLMKALIISALIALTGTLASVAFADSPKDSDSSRAGTFVQDSIITTKIKAKLAEKHMSTLTDIQVDTDNAGIVWLSGKAPTKDARDLAGMIAKDTDGVKGVHNKIVVPE